MTFSTHLLLHYKQLHSSWFSKGRWVFSLANAVPAQDKSCFDFSSSASKYLVTDLSKLPFSTWRDGSNQITPDRKFHTRRSLTLPAKTTELHTLECFNTFIKSSLNTLEGSNYRWLNKNKCCKKGFDEDGVFFVVTGAFFECPLLCTHDQMLMIENVKLLQQRYPKLQVFGLEHCSSVFSAFTENHLVKTTEEEYVTFPVLLTEKEFSELTKEPCYLLFEGLQGSFLRFDWNVDTKVVARDIEKFSLVPSCNSVSGKELNSYGMRQADASKGYYACPSYRNFMLHHPGCVSVDEYGKRIFLSDSNHHRIIITDIDGKIVDYVGSSPGFEDGGFGSAELLRPAGSVYHAEEDCLYFADSENHAIRRADMRRRVVETIYPSCDRKDGGIWNWIMDKIGMKREIFQDMEELDPNSISFPWHVLMLGDNDLLVFNRRLESSWVLSMEKGHVKSIIRGLANVMEAYKELIFVKLSPLSEVFASLSSQRFDASGLLDEFQLAVQMSAIAELDDYYLFCDTAGQKVLKYNKISRNIADFRFSDLQMLGMPYWLVRPTESIVPSVNAYGFEDAHLQHFTLLPGRCDIWVNIHIPRGTKLVAPVGEECIWRQARGSAVEITDLEIVESAEKVGVAQQWYDELDNLAFSNPSEGTNVQQQDIRTSTVHVDDRMVRIKCVVNTSPGTSEAVVSVALYLKHDRDSTDGPDFTATRQFKPCKSLEDEASIRSLEPYRSLAFIKPVQARIRLECADHPLRPNSREIISTNSNLDVNISLNCFTCPDVKPSS